MPQLCTICTHRQSRSIDLAIVAGKLSNRAIACQFGVNREAVRRHRADHLPETLKRGYEAQKNQDAALVMDELMCCVRITNQVLAACDEWLSDPDNESKYTLEPRADPRELILKAVAQLRPQAELLARLEGKLKDTAINILINPEWLKIRATLMQALSPFSEAREAVAS